MIYFYNLAIAMVVSLSLLPFWYMENPILVPGIQAVVNILILPIVLVVLNVTMFIKGKIGSFITLYVIIPLACLAGETCAYLNWGISTGNLLYPDEETILIMTFFSAASVGLAILLLGISNFILKVLKRI